MAHGSKIEAQRWNVKGKRSTAKGQRDRAEAFEIGSWKADNIGNPQFEIQNLSSDF